MASSSAQKARADARRCAAFICFHSREGVRVSVIVDILATDPDARASAAYFLRPAVLRLRPPLLRGTFPPARRASLRPIAIACLRLVTFLPDPPERRVPRLRSCIARSTFSDAFFPYF